MMVRAPAAASAARSVPGPASSRLVTRITRPPRPAGVATPKPSAPGNTGSAPVLGDCVGAAGGRRTSAVRPVSPRASTVAFRASDSPCAPKHPPAPRARATAHAAARHGARRLPAPRSRLDLPTADVHSSTPRARFMSLARALWWLAAAAVTLPFLDVAWRTLPSRRNRFVEHATRARLILGAAELALAVLYLAAARGRVRLAAGPDPRPALLLALLGAPLA